MGTKPEEGAIVFEVVLDSKTVSKDVVTFVAVTTMDVSGDISLENELGPCDKGRTHGQGLSVCDGYHIGAALQLGRL